MSRASYQEYGLDPTLLYHTERNPIEQEGWHRTRWLGYEMEVGQGPGVGIRAGQETELIVAEARSVAPAARVSCYHHAALPDWVLVTCSCDHLGIR